MLPEVTEYQNTLNQISRTWESKIQELEKAYPKRGRGGNVTTYIEPNAEHAQAWEAGREAAATADREARAAAKAALLASTDPAIVWMAEKNLFDSWPNETAMVSTWLPASYAELLEKGKLNGWCSDYRRMLDEAVAAGVITDQRTAHERLDTFLNSRFGDIGQESRDAIDELINAVVATATTKEA